MNGYGINAASYSVGSNFVVNTTAVSIGSNVSLTGATISGTSTDLTIRNATVQGNLVVAGSVTSVNTQSLVVNDNIIELADNNTTLDTVDSGWFSPAGNSTSVWYSGIVRQAAKSSNNNPYFWIFGSNTNPNTSTTIDTTANSVTGTLQAYLVPYGTGGAFVANSSTVLITANSTVSVNVTANNVSGNGSGVTSVNAIALGGKTESQLNVNSALTSNSTTYILANTGIISNSSGVFVDAAYINTISANNAAYLGGLAAASYANTSAPLITTSVTVGNATVNVTVNSTSFSGTSSNATNLNSQPGSYYTNATNITTGTLPYAQIPANIINTTAAFTDRKSTRLNSSHRT